MCCELPLLNLLKDAKIRNLEQIAKEKEKRQAEVSAANKLRAKKNKK